jgi:hypothetical protein
MAMNKKHRRTLEAVFEDPVRSNLSWRDIEAMFKASGAEISEREGSRICVAFHDVRAVFHRPHPRKEASKATIVDVREFLSKAGVTP